MLKENNIISTFVVVDDFFNNISQYQPLLPASYDTCNYPILVMTGIPVYVKHVCRINVLSWDFIKEIKFMENRDNGFSKYKPVRDFLRSYCKYDLIKTLSSYIPDGGVKTAHWYARRTGTRQVV